MPDPIKPTAADWEARTALFREMADIVRQIGMGGAAERSVANAADNAFARHAQQAREQALEEAAKVAECLTVCMEWWEGHERSVRHPSPTETATAIRALKEPKP